MLKKQTNHKRPKEVLKEFKTVKILKQTLKSIKAHALENDKFDYEAAEELVNRGLER